MPKCRKAAQSLLDDALWWLRETYAEHGFSVERDLVRTLQRRLSRQAAVDGLGVRVFNDYGVEPGARRHLSADIRRPRGRRPGPLVVVEFKYEPSPRRLEVDRRKLPVTDWAGAAAAVERIRRWVDGWRGARCLWPSWARAALTLTGRPPGRSQSAERSASRRGVPSPLPCTPRASSALGRSGPCSPRIHRLLGGWGGR